MNDLIRTNCINRDSVENDYHLDSLAGALKKKQIKEIAASYKLNLSDKLQKKEMLLKTLPIIRRSLPVKIKRYSGDDLKILKSCITADSEKLNEAQAERIIQSQPFADGLIFLTAHKETVTARVPYEIAGPVMEYCAGHLLGSEKSEPLEVCARAAAVLYGCFTPELAAEMVAHAYGLNFTYEQTLEFLNSRSPESGDNFTFDGTKGIYRLEDGSSAETPATRSVDYYLPTAKEAEFCAECGFETNNYYYRKIVGLVYSVCNISYENAEKLLKNIQLWCITGANSHEVMDYISEAGVAAPIDNFNFLLSTLEELYVNARRWDLKGNRLCDVENQPSIKLPRVSANSRPQQSNTGEPINKPSKPGRNDPCPCGSGKKYKKCCGKDL